MERRLQMWKIEIPQRSIDIHESRVGGPIVKALTRLAEGEPITWAIGGSKVDRDKRIHERDVQLSQLKDINAKQYFRRILECFTRNRLVVARPVELLDFTKEELKWRDSLWRTAGDSVKNACHRVISRIFNYDAFVRGCFPVCADNGLIKWAVCDRRNAQWSAWHFIDSLNVRYCPYCNAETVGNAALKTRDGGIKLHQSELDHFIPHEKYPLLSLSLYNLVPSCSRCNSRFKLAYDIVPGYMRDGVIPILNPYVENIHDLVRFEYAPRSISSLFPLKGNANNPIKLYAESGVRKDQAEEYLREFHIGEVYRDFYDEELATNIRIAALYSPTMRRALNKKYKGITSEEIDKVLFRASSDPRQINKSRFAKAIIDLQDSLPCY